MLQVGVHDGDIGRAGGQDPFDGCPGQSAPADAAQTAYASVHGGKPFHHIGRAVGRIVVDENGLPRDILQRPVQTLKQDGDIAALLERRNDNGEFGRGRAAVRPNTRVAVGPEQKGELRDGRRPA